jgi:hypothetical protein
MMDEIEITEFPNCNFPHIAMKRHGGRLQVTYDTKACLNRLEINARWGMPLDAMDIQCLHSALDDWIECRNEMLK